jgi:sensor histidine kinase YesM
MIHDRLFKYIAIPLAGLALPVFSGLIDWADSCWQDTLFFSSLFLVAAFFNWITCSAITQQVHEKNLFENNVSARLFVLCLCAALCSTILALAVVYLWLRYSSSLFSGEPVTRFCLVSAFIGMFTVSVDEVFYLNENRSLSSKIIRQLQAEKSSLEMGLLQNELEPHFILNSFTSLFHLIKGDPDRAQRFVQKLSSVYKYLLANKEREMISIGEELDFIQNYYYLLQIRYDHTIKLQFDLGQLPRTGMVIPCALQILVENAVKHNQFSEQDPLEIWIKREEDWLVVENGLQPKPFSMESTKIGLNNLILRYELLSNKKIRIHKTASRFSVYLPLIKQ